LAALAHFQNVVDFGHSVQFSFLRLSLHSQVVFCICGIQCWSIACHISNNPSFRLKHPGVPDGSDGSDGPSYNLTENYTLPVGLATGRVAYSRPLLGAWYTHHQNDTCVTLFAGAAVLLSLFTQRMAMFMPFFGL